MSGTANRTERPRRDAEFWLAGTGFVLLLVALAAVAAWPIYETPWYMVLVGSAVVLALGVAALVQRRRWSMPAAAGIAFGVYLLVGVPLAVPDALRSLDTIPGGFLDLIAGIVTGWRQLLTIAIPVGSYQATGVPALIVFLFGTVAALLAVWRLDRWWLLAAPVLVLLQAFGLLFGSDSASGALRVGGLVVPAPRETVLGFAALVSLTLLLVWRSSWIRRQALTRARALSGVSSAASRRPAVLRRAGLAAAMLVVAGSVAGMAAVPLGQGPREVLRSSSEPDLRIREEVSPLSIYRAAFDTERDQATLLTVRQISGPPPERLRLAALPWYDGTVFRVSDPAAAPGSGSDFRRVPYEIPGAPPGERSRISVTIGDLGGMWLPLPDNTVRIDFGGDRRAALVDRLYYSSTLRTAIELVDGGLAPGDEVEIEAVAVPAVAADVLDAIPPQQRSEDETIPDELGEWVRAQELGSDGAALVQLVGLLRSRGYLSHDLIEPTEADSWSTRLLDYAFEPARAGHSTDRIAQMFAAINAREDENGWPESQAPAGLLVSAAGDDEQFATAAALIARYLGYESRIVVGFRLDSTGDIAEPAACVSGVCLGANLTAWAEVREPGGAWAVLDASPQFADSMRPSVESSRDPELPTNVPSQVAESRLPPEGVANEGEGGNDDEADAGLDLGWLWTALRVLGVVLLVLAIVAAPFLAVVAAKRARRSRRRNAADPEARIAGGWLEWIDTAVDHGVVVPANATRSKIADGLLRARPAAAAAEAGPEGMPNAAPPADPGILAGWADHAVFSAVPPTEDESLRFWEIVDAERRRWSAGLPWWRRLRSSLSLASFVRAADARFKLPGKAQTLVRRWTPTRGATTSRFTKGVTRARRTAGRP